MTLHPVLQTVIVGGGPAGTALLTAASKLGRLGELAQAGLAIIDRNERIGAGKLGGYAINSDSTAETFLTSIKDSTFPSISSLASHGAARQISGHIGDLGVPLTKVGDFLDVLGDRLHALVEGAGGSVLTGQEVLRSERTAQGLWKTRIRDRATGGEAEILSRTLVIATGGHQPLSQLRGEYVAGVPLADRYEDKLVQSDEVLSLSGLETVRSRIAGRARPRIAIIGGSTSAVTAANKLLKGEPALELAEGSVTLLHRRPLRPFYPSASAALAEGYDDFGPQDICPVSGFVYRLAGFRLEARELVMKALGIGGRQNDPRFRLHRITGPADDEAVAILDRADLIVAALGYRPHALPLFGSDGQPIALASESLGRPAMVDNQCRIVDADGEPVPDLFGIGLAAGFVPHGDLGGEPSFSGQANGLWLWQNGVGFRIVEQLLAQQARRPAPLPVARAVA
ncbi:FAD-dependent oxidoreductase [Flavisphingomonas formosensis]|uniref:FAD-dependent oxidoreductase n=1 Tax=Flavisphingomonas formosensis TaxID=861534 RepID=UPI001E5E78C9|nr:FAD-dependent oxidoreductase [Sphingomonas formosensis]